MTGVQTCALPISQITGNMILDSVDRVRQFLEHSQIDALVKVLPPESTKTSALAAHSLGCTVAEIAKTIGFVYHSSEQLNPVLIVLSGARRVNPNKLSTHLNIPEAKLHKMSAEEVKTYSGYSIGGVPPFPHYPNIHVSADRSLFEFSAVWAAAGSNNTVMKIKPEVLTKHLKIPVVEVSE